MANNHPPNDLLKTFRERLFGTQQAMADAANKHLAPAYWLDGNDIGKIERGVVGRPSRPRCAALRTICAVATDAEIGLVKRSKVGSGHSSIAIRPRSEGDPRDRGATDLQLHSGTTQHVPPTVIPVTSNPTRMQVRLADGNSYLLVGGLAARFRSPRKNIQPEARGTEPNAAIGAFDSGTLRDPARSMSQPMPEWAEHVRRGVADPARYADGDLVDAFWLQLETAKAIDGRFGAAAALSTARGVVDVVESMISEVPELVRRELSVLGADAAEFVGWLFRDLADSVQARYWYDQAMEYAQICGDLPMQGFVLLRKSQLAYESRSGNHVRMLARAAIEGPWRLPPHLHAEALLQVARGDAMVGQDVDMDNATKQAREVADGADLTLREASCWIEANEPERAAQLYEDGLAVEGVSIRDVGYYRARQAIALAHAEQPDLAAGCAREALSTSIRTGSSRTYSSVQKASGVLVPWQARDAVVALNDALTATPLPIQREPG